MSIEELGSLGEFVGALGVVISLMYLAFQIRVGSRSPRFESHHTRTYPAQYQLILTNPSSAHFSKTTHTLFQLAATTSD